MTAPSILIRPITADDWARYRDIRLQMLAEIPIAFTETVATVQRRDEAAWRSRLALSGGVRLVAIDADADRWAGTMGVMMSNAPDVEGALLVGVYVDPDYRGVARGVTDALIGAVEAWAAERSTTLTLHVHEDNRHARSAYRRLGFAETGTTIPYPLDPRARELEMVKVLR